MGVVWLMGWHNVLTLENIAANRNSLHQAIADHRSLALLAYVGLYIAVAGLSLPGGTILTLTGGLLFGWLVGSAAAVVGATAGATIVFLIVRSALGEALTRKARPLLEKVRGRLPTQRAELFAILAARARVSLLGRQPRSGTTWGDRAHLWQ